MGIGKLADTLLWAGVSLLVLALLLLPLDYEVGLDQSIFFLMGQGLLEHGDLYAHVFDIKPPPVYVLYALAIWLFGDVEIAPRLLELAFQVIAGGAFLRIGAALGDWRTGLAGFALYLLAVVPAGIWETAQVETLAAPLLALGTLGLLRGLDAREGVNRGLFVASLLLTAAALMKPTLGGFWLAALLAALWHARGARRVVPPFIAGGVVAVIAIEGGAEIFGATRAFLELAGNLYGDYAAGKVGIAASGAETVEFFLREQVHLLIGAGLLLVFLPQDRVRRAIVLFLALAFVLSLVGVAVQGRNFRYHYAASFVPLAMMAGWGFVLLIERMRGGARQIGLALMALLVAVTLIAPVAGGLLPVAMRVSRMLTGSQEPLFSSILWRGSRWPEQARAIAEHFDLKDEPILIWSAAAPLQYFHGRHDFRPATRFIKSSHLRILPDGTLLHARMMEDLAASKPRVVLLRREDHDTHLKEGLPHSSQHVQTSFKSLNALLESDYVAAGDFEGYDVYLRREP